MANFTGSFEDVAVDSKGRINVPSLIRKSLPSSAPDRITITRGFDGCLAGYALDDWGRKLEELRQFSPNDPQTRRYVRVIGANTIPAEIDRQGRIHLPRKWLEMADIRGRVTIIGAIDRIEFWNPDHYRAYMKDADEEYDQIAERFRV